MTFPEIFDKFKNHDYIRRESWNKDLFIQYRSTAPLIRMVLMGESAKEDLIKVLDLDCRISAEDMMANDWIDIGNC